MNQLTLKHNVPGAEELLIDSFESLERAYQLLYKEQTEINSGLKYARLIQQGILPKHRHFKRIFNEYFVIHKQRDIIGGDFYWIGQNRELSFITVGDCAGHGVPGALLSMLGQSLLNYYVLGKGITDVAEILSELDCRLVETFQPAASDEYTNDWISLSICCLNKKNNTIEFAGAGQSMFVTDKSLQTVHIKGNKTPLGQRNSQRNLFKVEVIPLDEVNACYMFSDGVKDQFGGQFNKKLMLQRLVNKISELSVICMDHQRIKFEKFFLEWQGKEEQTDDMTLIGFKP